MGSSIPVTPMRRNDENTRPFWDACRDGVFLMAKCLGCEGLYTHQDACCPACGGTERAWTRASGRGRLYSYVIAHGQGRGGHDAVVAIVELDEGPRIMTELTGVDPASMVNASVGMRVEARLVADRDGVRLVFEPCSAV